MFHFNKPPYSLTGIVIVTSVPLWNSLDILILPLNDDSSVCFAMARPRPVPPVFTRTCLVYTIETVENVRKFIFLYSDTVIGYF